MPDTGYQVVDTGHQKVYSAHPEADGEFSFEDQHTGKRHWPYHVTVLSFVKSVFCFFVVLH